jgi:hypothetical protein
MKNRLILTACASALLLGLPAAAPAWAKAPPAVASAAQGGVEVPPLGFAKRVLAMIRDRAIVSTSGKSIPVAIDTICVHGDNPAAVAMARAVRSTLEQAGVAIRPMAAALAG